MRSYVHFLAGAGLLVSNAAVANNAFNPKISLILDAAFSHYSSAAEAEVPGALLGPETEFRTDGFAIGESELTIEANIDDQFHGWTTIALENEDGETHVAVEEAYIDTTSLPAGLSLKFGRFFSDIGYLNSRHGHSWNFVDAPLVYRALFAGRLVDDGLQVRWVAPSSLLVEFGAEALRGDGFPGGGEERDGINSWTVFSRLGGDVGSGGAWRLGFAHVDANAKERASGEEVSTLFSGDSRTQLIDFTYKWAPHGNPSERNFQLQAEYMQRKESGTLIYDPDASAINSQYAGRQNGWYLQAVYGFVRNWRVGARYDQFRSDNRLSNPAAGSSLETLANASGHKPNRHSLMLDWSPSEFSRVRLQYNRDKSRGDIADEQVFLQYIFSLGAHPAHQF